MKTYTNLYSALCSYENLLLAWKKARKRKTLKDYVMEFDSNLEDNLNVLKYELETFTYSPKPMTTFVIRDPKTRKINASDFRDRVVHHALCNIIAPILEKIFIYDSFANQKSKGTHKAIKRFEKFGRKVYLRCKIRRGGEQNKLFEKGMDFGYVLKADIRHYFETVDHEILLRIITHRIKDASVIWLIKIILRNNKTEVIGKGMPLGNLTSQFFANVYLNEFDLFIKHELKAKYYIRYVDDFVILHRDKRVLENWRKEIDEFLESNLRIYLHPEKTKIISLGNGITFLGFRLFCSHRLLKKSNARRIWKRLDRIKQSYLRNEISIEKVRQSLDGWLAYAKFANTYRLRKKILEKFNLLYN